MPKILYSLILLITLFSASVSWSQNDTIDNLKEELDAADNDKDRVLIYNRLIDEYWHSSPSTAIIYTDSAYLLASKLDFPEGLLYSISNKGVAFYTTGDYDSAELYYEKALDLEKDLGIETNTIFFYLNLLKLKGDYQLLKEVVENKISTTRIDQIDPELLRTVVDVYITTGDFKKSEKYLNELITRAEYQEDYAYQSKSYRIISRYLNLTGNYDSAFNLLNKALDYYRNESDSLTMAECKLNLGGIRLTQGKSKAAQDQFQEALKLYQSANYDFGMARAKYELGRLYSELGEYSLASEYLYDALKVYEDQNNLNEISNTYIELGWINNYQNLSDKALNFIQKAIAISDSVDNTRILGKAYNMLGIYYDNQSKFDEALEAYDTSLIYMNELGDKKGQAAVLYNIGFIEEKRRNFKKAEELYLEAYDIELEIGNSIGIAISESSLGSLYTKMGDLNKAERFLSLAREKLKRISSLSNLLDNYKYTVRLLEKQRKYEQANEFYKKIIELKEKIANNELKNNLAELEVKYDLRNKEREIEFLNLENTNRSQELELKEQTIKNQRFFIITVLLAAMLLLSLVVAGYRLLRFRNKANKELELLNKKIQEKNEEITAQSEELQEANVKISYMNESLEEKIENATQDLKKAYKELDTFFYRSSHDFRGPLTTFLGLKELADKTISDPKALEIFKKVEETALQLDKMVNKLKAISLISDDSLSKDRVRLSEVTDAVLDNKSTEIKRRKVTINKSYIDDKELDVNAEILNIIVENIVENALMYNSDYNPQITLKIEEVEKGVEFSVADNGVGIHEKYLPLVFDMYFRSNEYSTGNGLGLYLVKKAVDNLKGSIEIESVFKRGTTVKVTFPFNHV